MLKLRQLSGRVFYMNCVQVDNNCSSVVTEWVGTEAKGGRILCRVNFEATFIMQAKTGRCRMCEAQAEWTCAYLVFSWSLFGCYGQKLQKMWGPFLAWQAPCKEIPSCNQCWCFVKSHFCYQLSMSGCLSQLVLTCNLATMPIVSAMWLGSTIASINVLVVPLSWFLLWTFDGHF